MVWEEGQRSFEFQKKSINKEASGQREKNIHLWVLLRDGPKATGKVESKESQ